MPDMLAVRSAPLVRRTRRGQQAIATMVAEVRAGLARRPLPELPCKYFYDERGSALFEEITRLPEYYQTRTESAILERHAAADRGGGRSSRARRARLGRRPQDPLLPRRHALPRLARARRPARDQRGLPARVGRAVSRPTTPRRACAVSPATSSHDLPALGPGGGRLLLFLAGTIGNLHPDDLPAFFRAAAVVLAPGRRLPGRRRPGEGPGAPARGVQRRRGRDGGVQPQHPAGPERPPRRPTSTLRTSSTAPSTTRTASGSRCACAPCGP